MIRIDDVILRPEDEAECRLGGMTGREALRFSMERSDYSYVFVNPKNNIPIAFFGWRNDSACCASCKAWMLSTPELERCSVFFLRHSRRVLETLLADHYSVEVLVDHSYTKAVRWLEWLGFRREGVLDHFSTYVITKGGRA